MKAETPKGKQLLKGFNAVANKSLIDYLSQWTFDNPAIITSDTYHQLHQIQKYLYRLICHFATHYDQYKSLMPVSERVDEILKFCNDKPYQPGWYRTDFVIDTNYNIKLIEITCRFALNGLFVSGFFNCMSEKYISNKKIKNIDPYSGVFDYLMSLYEPFNHICFLKGQFNNNESKFAVSIFEEAGFKVHVLPAHEVEANTHLFENAIVFSELNQEDWFSFSDDTVKKIINSNMVNDPRTIFLIHDKRFFSFLCDRNFVREVLNETETDFFINYITPTYRPNQMPELWSNAKNHKDNWILKPFDKGRSMDVFAGCVTNQEKWENVISEQKNSMVLQPFISSWKYKGFVKDQSHEDYVTGILLFLNDEFFGPGVFRSSSHPVTNVVDDRKLFPLITDEIKDSEHFLIL
jgi:hypothetical protein